MQIIAVGTFSNTLKKIYIYFACSEVWDLHQIHFTHIINITQEGEHIKLL